MKTMTTIVYIKTFIKWVPFLGFGVIVESEVDPIMERQIGVFREDLQNAEASLEAAANRLNEGDYENLELSTNLQLKLMPKIKRLGDVKQAAANNLQLANHYISTLESTSDPLEKRLIFQNIGHHFNKYILDLRTLTEEYQETSLILDLAKTQQCGVIDIDLFIDLFNKFQDYLHTLSVEHQICLSYIYGFVFVLGCTISLATIFLGKLFIVYLKLEARFPNLAAIIKLKRKIKNYYFVLNLIYIIIMLSWFTFCNLFCFLM